MPTDNFTYEQYTKQAIGSIWTYLRKEAKAKDVNDYTVDSFIVNIRTATRIFVKVSQQIRSQYVCTQVVLQKWGCQLQDLGTEKDLRLQYYMATRMETGGGAPVQDIYQISI